MDHLVKENEPYYDHTFEEADDMPAHAKCSLFGVSLTIPIANGRLALGTWQGIYLYEFRNYGVRGRLWRQSMNDYALTMIYAIFYVF